MSFVRRRCLWIAVLWLAGQFSTLAVTPARLCMGTAGVSVSAPDDDVCCEGMAPGQYCPMHKHRNGGHGSNGGHRSKSGSAQQDGQQDKQHCKLQNGCTPQPAGLEALSVGPAIIPERVCTKDQKSGRKTAFVCDQLISRSSPPSLPPPRA